MDLFLLRNFSKNLILISPEATVKEAYELMTNKRIRHLVVTNEGEEVVGVVSDRDLQRAMRFEIKDFYAVKVIDQSFDPQHLVRDVMSWPVKQVNQLSTVSEVAQRMIEEKISAFLVTNAEELVIGIVTTEDLLKVLVSELRDSHKSLAELNPKLSLNLLNIGQALDGLAKSGI